MFHMFEFKFDFGLKLFKAYCIFTHLCVVFAIMMSTTNKQNPHQQPIFWMTFLTNPILPCKQKAHLNKKKTTLSRCMNSRTRNHDFSVFVIHVWCHRKGDIISEYIIHECESLLHCAYTSLMWMSWPSIQTLWFRITQKIHTHIFCLNSAASCCSYTRL